MKLTSKKTSTKRFSTLTAAIAVLALSACGSNASSGSQAGEPVDTSAIKANSTVEVSGEKLSGSELVDKIYKNSQTWPATVKGKLELEAKGFFDNDGSVNMNLDLKYDKKTNAFSVKFDGKSNITGTQTTTADAEAYGERDGQEYKVYASNKGEWIQTAFTQDQIDQLSKLLQARTSGAADFVPSEYLDMLADIEVTENGDELVVRAAPKKAVLKELATRSQGNQFEIDPDKTEAFLRLIVDKKSLATKSFAVVVDVKSKDGSASAKGELSFDLDANADVKISIPDKAKNGQKIPSEQILSTLGVNGLSSGGSDGSGGSTIDNGGVYPDSDESPTSSFESPTDDFQNDGGAEDGSSF